MDMIYGESINNYLFFVLNSDVHIFLDFLWNCLVFPGVLGYTVFVLGDFKDGEDSNLQPPEDELVDFPFSFNPTLLIQTNLVVLLCFFIFLVCCKKHMFLFIY